MRKDGILCKVWLMYEESNCVSNLMLSTKIDSNKLYLKNKNQF